MSIEIEWECDYCGEVIATESEYDTHTETAHNQDDE